jgi:DNA-binding Lrp family transcriptional regulator
MSEMLDAIDETVLLFAQGDLPLMPRPYADLARTIEISEEEICSRLRRFNESGLIRRFGAILRHDKAGYRANAMVVWKITGGKQDEAAAILAKDDAVSHLYSRPAFPGWPCNLFSMLHARDENELAGILSNLRRRLSQYSDANRVFRSIREFKKTSMKYFAEDNDD